MTATATLAEQEDFEEPLNERFDDNVHQACYVFNAADEDADAYGRPAKKRKLNGVSTPETTFPSLLNGDEPETHVHLRHDLFQKFWSAKQTKIEQTLNQVNPEVVTNFANFVQQSDSVSINGKLPAALLVSESNSNTQRRLLNVWHEQATRSQSHILIQLQPSHCPTLQTCLKNVIKIAITETAGPQIYNDHLAKHKRLIPMNFDLELLQEFVQERSISKVVVSILDGETFDITMLMEVISSLQSWSDRIPFVLVLGLATTVELLEGRLATFAVKLLDAQIFELSSTREDVFYQAFNICQSDEDTALFLGPAVISILSEITRNQGGTVEALTRAIKYVYMSHFFSNPLSVLLGREQDLSIKAESIQTLCAAIRNTDSFHRYCENSIRNSNDKRSRGKVRDLLKNDIVLLNEIRTTMTSGRRFYRRIAVIISALTDVLHTLNPSLSVTESRFETIGRIYDSLSSIEIDFSNCSTYLKEILPLLHAAPSQQLLEAVESLDASTIATLNLETSHAELRSFQSALPAAVNKSVRSVHDPFFSKSISGVTSKFLGKNNATTTAFQPPKLDKHEKQYTSLLDMFIATLEKALSNPRLNSSFDLSDHLLSEAYVFNLRQPLHASLIFPRPRYSIERALNRPGDYLGCGHDGCTVPTEGGDSSNNTPAPPAASVLYLLLQEAPTIINVRDLFDAFCSRLSALSLSLLPPSTAEAKATTADEPKKVNGEKQEKEDSGNTATTTVTADRDHREVDDGERERERMLMTLFYRALADLKLLGLVKASANATVKKRAVGNSGGSGGGAAAAGDVDFIAKTSWLGL